MRLTPQPPEPPHIEISARPVLQPQYFPEAIQRIALARPQTNTDQDAKSTKIQPPAQKMFASRSAICHQYPQTA
jgi:hypothetical protein